MRENIEASYETICREICRKLDLHCCSIWFKEINRQQRLGYFEKEGSTDDLTISNLDFEINKHVLEHKVPVVIENLKNDKRFLGVKTIPLSVRANPILHDNSVIGSITFYNQDRINEVLRDVIDSIAVELAFGLEQLQYNFTASRQKKLRKELNTARIIQQSLLPKQIPEVQGITLGVRFIPTYEISGDYYDFIITDHQNLGIVVGDVMGKGIPAALLMGIARTITRSIARHDLVPHMALSEINSSLFPDLSNQGMFLTMFFALYNPQQKALLYASAGHNPPIILEGGSEKIGLLKSRGIFIGGCPKLSYNLQTRKLGSGDLVIFYTDGLTEAKNHQGEQFGVERVAEILKEYRYCEVPAMLDCLTMRLMQFIGDREQSDDITFIVLKAE